MAADRPLSASLEDYLEAIYHVVETKQAARAKDIVERLGVHNSSVTQALRSLAEKGLVNYAPYDLVTLTEEGQTAALDVVQRHRSLRAFLEEVLGLEPEHAEKDACRLEHDLSPEVARRLRLYMAYHRDHPERGIRWDPEDGGFGTAGGTS
jgi:DtxR family Mn-dependent transcriptional regulator